MASNKIIQFGDPVLRKTSAPVTVFHSKFHKFLDKLGGILKKTRNGAGLAAPQIGRLKRVSVINLGNGLIELINPEILSTAGTQIGLEGCLSFIGYSGTVERASYVKIKNTDRYGKEHTLEGEGLFARCIQHEIDHLNGILYIDHIEDNVLYNDITNQKVNLQFAIELTKVK
jgi:peptide deformylase